MNLEAHQEAAIKCLRKSIMAILNNVPVDDFDIVGTDQDGNIIDLIDETGSVLTISDLRAILSIFPE